MAPLIRLNPIHAKAETRTMLIDVQVKYLIAFGDFTGESLQERP